MDKRKDPDDKKPRDGLQRHIRLSFWYIPIALLAMWLFQERVAPLAARTTEIPYSEFKSKLAAGQVVEVIIGRERVQGTLKDPDPAAKAPATVPFQTLFVPDGDPKLAADLDKAGVKYGFEKPSSPIGGFLLSWLLPLGLIFLVYSIFARRLGAGGAGRAGGVFGVGKSKATVVKAADVGVTFKDVGGADDAIAELQEIIQFLKEPQRFATLGGRIPKGVLIVGPPGTGKTLLAKATAGEAGVSFFETSGSEFVEMFVGVGAARVRDLFEQARKAAPAIVFIDEIDAIGQSRGGAMRLGANDEREQTLNQLLGEIDGFKTDPANPVILMAATNRPEVLDPALMRAGRFDRQIAVGNPDLIGRGQILRIHTRKIRLAPDFDIERAARMTPGFSGADLANVVNEAALLAARRQAEGVTLEDFQVAIERVVAGLEKKTRVMTDLERTTVAHHEAGHALVASMVPNGDPVTKISIVPHSRGALGYTMQLPTEDRFLLTIGELEDRLAVMLGGRAAETVIFDTISTGASDDIMRATELARRMVTEFGMSEKLGSVRYAGRELQYLGGVAFDGAKLSSRTHDVIDAEVQRIVTAQLERARALLSERRAALEALARQLLKQETVDGSAVRQALDDNPGGEGAVAATRALEKFPESSTPPVQPILPGR
jgi:cell division protease FtsH